MQPKNENISGFFQQNFKIVFGRIESRLKRGPILELWTSDDKNWLK